MAQEQVAGVRFGVGLVGAWAWGIAAAFIIGWCGGMAFDMYLSPKWWWTCSRCGGEFPRDPHSTRKPNYCPICGAREEDQ